MLLWCELLCFIHFALADFGHTQLHVQDLDQHKQFVKQQMQQDLDQHKQFVTEQMQMCEHLFPAL